MKKIITKCCYRSGVPRLLEVINKKPAFKILTYHHITQDQEPFLPHLTQEDFSRQLRYLCRNYRIIRLGDLIEMIRKGESIPLRVLALTFDDGYKDFYHNAWPLLKKLELPATVFIPTGFVDTPQLPWPDELGYIFSSTSSREFQGEIEGVDCSGNWGNIQEALAIFTQLKSRMKSLSFDSIQQIMTLIREQLGSPPLDISRKVMSSAQIKELSQQGVEFGSHTVDHVIVGKVSPLLAKEQIFDSYQQVRNLTGKVPAGFCYPNGQPGDYNAYTRDLVKEAGYRYACLTVPGGNNPGTDLFSLKRCWTGGVSLENFALRLAWERF